MSSDGINGVRNYDNIALVAEQAYAADLKSVILIRYVGSTPT